MDERASVRLGVLLAGVAVEGPSVRVDVYGSDDNLCGCVTLTFDRRHHRADAVRQLIAWERRQTPLTLVMRDGEATFTNERALFESTTP